MHQQAHQSRKTVVWLRVHVRKKRSLRDVPTAARSPWSAQAFIIAVEVAVRTTRTALRLHCISSLGNVMVQYVHNAVDESRGARAARHPGTGENITYYMDHLVSPTVGILLCFVHSHLGVLIFKVVWCVWWYCFSWFQLRSLHLHCRTYLTKSTVSTHVYILLVRRMLSGSKTPCQQSTRYTRPVRWITTPEYEPHWIAFLRYFSEAYKDQFLQYCIVVRRISRSTQEPPLEVILFISLALSRNLHPEYQIYPKNIHGGFRIYLEIEMEVNISIPDIHLGHLYLGYHTHFTCPPIRDIYIYIYMDMH